MKNMFKKSDVEDLKERLSSLRPEASPKWGSFSADQMVCHLIDQLEFALSSASDEPTELMSGPPMFMRHLIRLYLPWPKGVPTIDNMLATQPESWDEQLETVTRLMDTFNTSSSKTDWPLHPFFGPLNGDAWAKLTWRHTNHHLKQFGC